MTHIDKNRRILTGTLTSLLVVATTSSASAAPTIFPRPGNRLAEVKNATTSPVLADSQDPNTLYVLPPPSGKSSLANVVYSANVGFCTELKNLQSYSENLSKRINDAVAEVDTYNEELTALRQEQGDYLEQAAGYKAANPKIDEVKELEYAIEDAQDRLDDLREARGDCEDDACLDDRDEEIDSLKAEIKSLKDELRATRREVADDLKAYERLMAKADAVQAEIDAVFALVDQKQDFIAKAYVQIRELYANLARLEGGFGGVDFALGWASNVATVRADNPGFNVTPIPTSEARLSASLVPGFGTSSYLASLPTILDLSIAGQVFDPSDPFHILPSVPERVTATARLSLIGACAQNSPEDFKIAKDNQGLPLYGLAETYLYPSTFRTRVAAKVNLWKAYSYMKTVSKKGGFFSSRTRTEIHEISDGDTFVEISTFDESGLSREEVAALEDMIKQEVMQDVLRVMGVPQYTSGSDSVDVIPPGDPGALVLASNTCGWFSYWCGGVSWVLRGLNAIFGSSKAEAAFEQRYNVWADRIYDRDVAADRPGMISFER